MHQKIPKLKQIVEGKWFRPIKNGFKMGCCDCGLVHRVDFKIKKRTQIRMRVYLDPKETKRERNRLKKRA